MNKVIVGTTLTGIVAILAVLNYRRCFPKPRAMCKKANKVEVCKFPVSSGGHELYGELMLPKGCGKKLPTIICSHGFNGSYRYFRDSVGMCLAMSGFAVYCFDFYGGSVNSKSGGSTTKMSVFTECDQLNDVIEALKAQEFVDTENLFLWGESQGGFVTAIAAAEHTEDIRSIVLFYPAFCAKDDMLEKYGTLDKVPEVADLFGMKVGRCYYEKLFDFDVYAEAKKYTGSVLIVHGDADKTVDISYGRKAAEVYQNASFIALHGEDHCFSGSGRLKAAKMVYDFLTSNLTGQS